MTQHNQTPAIYLAGPIKHAEDGGHGWRDQTVEATDAIDFLNPLNFFDGTEDIATILPKEDLESYETDTDEFVISDEELIRKDKEMVHKADALLIGYPEKIPAWGTPMEQAEVCPSYESVARGGPAKPVAVWHGNIDYEKLSPWLRYHATYLSQSRNECLRYLLAATDALPICISCRDEVGAEVTSHKFQVQGSDCEWCNDHVAMRPTNR